jgi:hypothetical protein
MKSHSLATAVSSGFTVLVLSGHVTILMEIQNSLCDYALYHEGVPFSEGWQLMETSRQLHPLTVFTPEQ